jgi:hypothetical protein
MRGEPVHSLQNTDKQSMNGWAGGCAKASSLGRNPDGSFKLSSTISADPSTGIAAQIRTPGAKPGLASEAGVTTQEPIGRDTVSPSRSNPSLGSCMLIAIPDRIDFH